MQNCNNSCTNNDALKLALNWRSKFQEDAQEYYNQLLVVINEILQKYRANNFIDTLYRGKYVNEINHKKQFY